MSEQKKAMEAKPRPAIVADKDKYKVKRKIADNLVSLQPGDSIVVKPVGTVRTLGGGVERWGKGGPPSVLPIEKQPGNEPALLVLQTVLESKFEVLGEDAIGKLFLIEAGQLVPGKNYRYFEVSEVEE